MKKFKNKMLVLAVGFILGSTFGYFLSQYLHKRNSEIVDFILQGQLAIELENENYEKAIYFNCRAIQNDPSNGWLYTSLGELYEISGKQEMAVFMYEKALDTDNLGNNMRKRVKDRKTFIQNE
mgnify:CR=1 FL=1